MELFKPGIYIDFMRLRRTNIIISIITFCLAIGAYFFPGPNWGLDFKGGTELQVAFHGAVAASELRSTLDQLGYPGSDVLTVERQQNQYIIRVREVSSLSVTAKNAIRAHILHGFPSCNAAVHNTDFSPGGDKITLELSNDCDPDVIQAALVEGGAHVRGDHAVARFGPQADHTYIVQLIGVGDRIMAGLRQKLGERAPDEALRIEWVGPSAGVELRNSAINSILYAMAFIMVYIAFRFDLRFAPGAVIAMAHDSIITAGVLVIIHREITLTTVAALLTIVGYSTNDTIVVYDRIRENMHRMRGKSLIEIINTSTSQTLSRTLLTSGVTALSIVAFLHWGTPVIRDFAITMVIGIVIGTYSSIYVAAPITEWLDRKYFRTAGAERRAPSGRGSARKARSSGGGAAAAPKGA